ncbi:hypothetical protein [Streptomyces sp. NPDC002215]|uniref:hypothetical protein n=1 Tax=Streptomyces sp. NPDC002215 TaxID=3154412 RepID=UPI00332BEFD8
MTTYSRSLKIVVCAVAVATAAVVTTGCDGSGGAGWSAASTEQSSYEVTEEVTGVAIDNHGGDIEIVTGTGTSVKVTETLEYSNAKPKTEHSVSGGKLVLKASACGGSASKCSVFYRVEVPAGVQVDASTGGGNVTGTGLGGTVLAKTGGGNVDVSFGVTGTGLGGTVLAKTGGGNVDVSFGSAPLSVSAESGGGNVTVKLPKGPYAVDATTAGGNRKVDVTVDDASPSKVRARSEGGDVTVTGA